jgi:hypothetical protein
MRIILALSILLISTLYVETNASDVPKLYAVIFDITVNPSGKVASLKISKVIDPKISATEPVDIIIPEVYFKAAKEFFLKRTYSEKPSHFYSYTFYDPEQPNRADIDPKARTQ